MPNQKADELLRTLNRKAQAYALKSTRLSDLLEEAEAFLNKMPGKVAAGVADGRVQLVFSRNAERWRLWLYIIPEFDEEGYESPVTECSVSHKAMAAKLLPELIDKLVDDVTQRLSEVEDGLEALKKVPFLNADSEGE